MPTDNYDLVRPATRIEISGVCSDPIVWAISDKTPPSLIIDGRTLVVDGLGIEPGQDGSGLNGFSTSVSKGEG